MEKTWELSFINPEERHRCIYGDSITEDTPLLLLGKDNQICIETISSIFDESTKIEYSGFKILDDSVRSEKEYSLTDYKVWTDLGWSEIKKVIRHKCEKKIFRVLTHTGVVDVTEDHSLISQDMEPVKPGQLQIGDGLLHSFPRDFTENKETMVKMKKVVLMTKTCSTCGMEKDIDDFYRNKKEKDGRAYSCKDCVYYKKSTSPLKNILKDFNFNDYVLTEKEAEVWGFFQGDGSCGMYKCPSGSKSSWALNNNNLGRLNYFKDILESIEPVGFKILDTLKSSGVYKLVPVGSIKYMVEKYRNLFYYQKDCNADGDKYKIVPGSVLNASREIKMAYWKGYYEADGSKTDGKSVDVPGFDVKGKIGAQCMYYLMKSIGYDMGINITDHPKKKEIYSLRFTNFKHKKEDAVKKIVDKGQIDGHVYDLETESGRFQAGVGQLMLFNTDSCMIVLNTPEQSAFRNASRNGQESPDSVKNLEKLAIKAAFELGKKMAVEATKIFKSPIKLEFEKVYSRYILLSKKRYIGLYYGKTWEHHDFVEKKGIVLKRRDNPEIVKKTYLGVLNPILDHGRLGIPIAIEFLEKQLHSVINGDINLADLVVTKTLSKSFGGETCSYAAGCEKPGTQKGNNNFFCNKHAPEGSVKLNRYATENSPHIALAKKIKERDPGAAPVANDRIGYVFIENHDNPLAKLYENAESPEIVTRDGLQIDVVYYIKNQLKNPIVEMLSTVIPDAADIFNNFLAEIEAERKLTVKNYRLMIKNKAKGQKTLKFVGKK